MKKIRLEIPVNFEDNSNLLLARHIWLKVIGNITKSYLDNTFSKSVPTALQKIKIEVNVPDELQFVEVVLPSLSTPVGDISHGWFNQMLDPTWKIPGLKKIHIIFDDMCYEVKVIDERPDFDAWKEFTINDSTGMWLFLKTWALVIYTTKTQTMAAFHWHPKIAREVE